MNVVIKYGRRLLGLIVFLTLPVLAWNWMVDGFGFSADHDIEQVALATGISVGQLECVGDAIEMGRLDLRLAGIGYGFEAIAGRSDRMIVRTPFSRTILEFREGGLWKDPRLGRGEFVPLTCTSDSLASESAR